MPDKENFNAVIETSSGEYGVCQYGECAGTLEARHDSSPCADRGMNIVCAGFMGGQVICAHETGKGYWQKGDICGTLRAEGENRPSRPSNIVCAGFMGGQVICYDARGNGDGFVSPTITGEHQNRITDYTAIAMTTVGVDQYNGDTTGDVSASIGTNCGISTGRNSVLEAVCVDQGGGKSSCSVSKECSPTLATTHDGAPVVALDGDKTSKDIHAVAYESTPTATVRRLLPVECERLMGFPDNWTRIPWKGKPEEECPDSPRYKACGNSMCVNVMRWIGERIDAVEKEMKEKEETR